MRSGQGFYHSSSSRSQPARSKKRVQDPRYIEGQRLLLEAMKYLMQQDAENNKPAVRLLSKHFRTRFRMSDRPAEVITSPGPEVKFC